MPESCCSSIIHRQIEEHGGRSPPKTFTFTKVKMLHRSAHLFPDLDLSSLGNARDAYTTSNVRVRDAKPSLASYLGHFFAETVLTAGLSKDKC